MTPGRLEAFSHGVIAIIITIMVLETSEFIGTITITCCCMPAQPYRVQYSGPISIYFSGTRYFPSPQGGWVKTVSPRCPPLCVG